MNSVTAAGTQIGNARASRAVYISQKQFVLLKSLLKSFPHMSDFKSAEQRMFSALSIFTRVDLLAVIPTGGGKSLLFMFESIQARSLGQKILIIVPTRSLQDS